MDSRNFLVTRENVTQRFLPTTIIKRETQSSATYKALPEILLISSYPPRECGIATYTQDLLKALNNQFSNSFSFKICALETGKMDHVYPSEVKYVLNTDSPTKYVDLTLAINNDERLQLVLIQHEFGFFEHNKEVDFLQFLHSVVKPVVIVFHTVLPQPDVIMRAKVRNIAVASASIIVMTNNAAKILQNDYRVPVQKIVVIPHGTHLVTHLNKAFLKEKYSLKGRKVLSTFGLLSSGKSIETTLEALPEIIKMNPDVTFLVLGKTHPTVKKEEGEKYRNMLESMVATLQLQKHVIFVNQYLPLNDLLEYLQLTDIYLFTSKDPNQAVSGTFSYAMSCGCPIISTPIPHAKEILKENTGIFFDFQNASQLAAAVNRLLCNESLRIEFSASALQNILPSAWENSAIAHALLLQKIAEPKLKDKKEYCIEDRKENKQIQTAVIPHSISLNYRLPVINLDHLKKMTTDVGIIQFSKINQPDIETGYTLDDNARALVAVCMHYELTGSDNDVQLMRIYLNFIKFCQQPDGIFLNYVDKDKQFTEQNNETNLSDANGRAIWALGYILSKIRILPPQLIVVADGIMQKALLNAEKIFSTRSMAFIIKGLYYYNLTEKSLSNTELIKILANRLVQMYSHESETDWQWFESYLTYGNSILPEAMLCAYLETGDLLYKEIAKASFDFLLSMTFNENKIKVISNKTWLQKGEKADEHGEQPIDVAYTILALSKFYDVFRETKYLYKMKTAFNWFLGENHLNHIIYNPCTGGCFDGLEETHVNLNQGSESTLSYLMARLTIEKYNNE